MASKTAFQRRHRRSGSARSNQAQPFFQQAEGETIEVAESSPFFAPSIGPVQAKFTMNQPGDPYEQEADTMSEKVVQRTSDKKEEDIQKMTAPEDEKVQKQDATKLEEEDKISRLPEKEDELQKMEAPEEDEKVQKKDAEMPEEEEQVVQSKSSSGGAPGVNPSVAQGIQNSKGKGSQLPKHSLQQMSNSFGHDFSGVRIHTDRESVQLNQALQAQAFTQGQDIYFNEGKYNPDSQEGKKLLAHELTHVVQQGGGGKLFKANNSVNLQSEEPETTTKQQTQSSEDLVKPPLLKLQGPFGGEFNIRTYQELLSATWAYIVVLNDSLEDVDESSYVYERGQQWIDDVKSWQPMIQSQGNNEVGAFTIGQAKSWASEYFEIGQGIKDYKISVTINHLISARVALEEKARQISKHRPELDDAMRAAFLSGDKNKMAEVASFLGTALDIGLDIHTLSRDLSAAIAEVSGGNIPPASKYTGWLERVNKVLASVNFLYSLSSTEAPTELGKALNGVNTISEAFSTSTTLFGLAPHIGLYANLYLVPMTNIIINRLGYLVDKHLHELNLLSVEIGWSPEMSNEPGGWPVYHFMLAVMHAEDATEVPDNIPPLVESFLLKQRDLIEAGSNSEMPTKGWWLWRKLNKEKIQDWIFNYREQLWAMFYGRMSIPKRHK